MDTDEALAQRGDGGRRPLVARRRRSATGAAQARRVAWGKQWAARMRDAAKARNETG